MTAEPSHSKITLPTPATCRWHRPRADGSRGCGLVAELLAAALNRPVDSPPKVTWEQCAACCSSFPPQRSHWNPVVASLLYTELDERGVSEACPLRHQALAALAPATSITPVLDPPSDRSWMATRLMEAVPATRVFGEVRRWSVAVTTSPRRHSVLEACLESIARAGWDDVLLFMDGTVRVPPQFSHLPTSWREHPLGACTAWYVCLMELVARQPDADAYVIFQDDVLLHLGERLRDYLQLALWPAARPGLVSLYNPGLIQRRGWHPLPRDWDWGTLAVVFPAGLARQFLSDPAVVRSCLPAKTGTHRPIPDMVRGWTRRAQVTIWCPSPSLTQHMGATSTLWPHAGLGRRRQAPWFSGDESQPWEPSSGWADFCEAAFACPPADAARYQQHVVLGRDRMRHTRAALCLICRDVGPCLPRTAARLEQLGQMFADYRILVIENDSSDSTVPFLQQWQDRNPRVWCECRQLDCPKFTSTRDLRRSAALACYRNRYLEQLELLHADTPFSHAIVVDADLIGGWSYDGIAHSFGQDGWDVIGSYGLDHISRPPQSPPRQWHYDQWAFRAPPDSAASALLGDHQDRLQRGHPLLAVESCFGGLAIYCIKGLLQCRYGGEDCEHVVLHRRLRQQGFHRQFLNPSQIVLRSAFVP